MANSWQTKAAIELIIFMGITYISVLLVMGTTGGVNWPTTVPKTDIPGVDIPIIGFFINIFVNLASYLMSFAVIMFNLFTFNIPGMPTEVRMLLGPLYTGMAIFCIIVFWDKIIIITEAIINSPTFIYNHTVAMIWQQNPRPYFHFHGGGGSE